MEPRGPLRRRVRGRASIRAKVALLAALLSISVLGTLGYLHASALSRALTGAATEQGVNNTAQLARATGPVAAAVVSVIPYSASGLDGVAVYDRSGRVKAVDGGKADLLRTLNAEAARVARTKKMVAHFRTPGGDAPSELRSWTPEGTVHVTVIPHEGGAMAAVYHVDWATDRLRSVVLGTALSVAGGAAFIGFALMLLLGKLVAEPVGRLAREVRQLGEGNLGAALSPPRSPELRQLAADISQMRDDLLQAVRDSSTDPLTGVANHRGFHERLDAEVAAAIAGGRSVGLIALDLDELKSINDRLGHQAGDRVIEAVAKQIAASCAPTDLCARIGGDEFAVLCPGRDRAGAAELAELIGKSVASLSLTQVAGPAADGTGLRISVAAGCSDLPGSARTKDELVLQADAALYASKGLRSRPAAQREAPAAEAAPRLERTVRALTLAAGLREGAGDHAESVARYAVAMGAELGLGGSDLDALRRAGLLHDAGMVGVPEAVLAKPGPLTDEERALVRAHAAYGYRVLRAAAVPARECEWVLHHHEQPDGKGYPHGLSGEEVPLQSRILLVADAYEAMTSARPHRAARSSAEALAELRRCSGTQFDATVVEAFARALEHGDEPAWELGVAAGDDAVAPARGRIRS